MITLVPFNPDGTPVRGRKDRLWVYERPSEARALLSCAKAWWTRKGVPKPVPEGATVHAGELVRRPPRQGELVAPDGRVFVGELAYRYERLPVLLSETRELAPGEEDDVVSTRLAWVDVRVRAHADAEAAALAEARRKHAAQRAARRATHAEVAASKGEST